MLFRYDFGEKLDTTKFNVQAKHYIGQIRQIEYHLVLPNYKLIITIDTPDNSNTHLVTAKLSSLQRDEDGEIKQEEWITPAKDVRFQDFKIVKEIWKDIDKTWGGWTSNSATSTVDKILILLKAIHKINNLRVFL